MVRDRVRVRVRIRVRVRVRVNPKPKPNPNQGDFLLQFSFFAGWMVTLTPSPDPHP